jgi:hypothetical protein
MRDGGINRLISFEIFASPRNFAFTPMRAKLPCAAEIAGLFTHR